MKNVITDHRLSSFIRTMTRAIPAGSLGLAFDEDLVVEAAHLFRVATFERRYTCYHGTPTSLRIGGRSVPPTRPPLDPTPATSGMRGGSGPEVRTRPPPPATASAMPSPCEGQPSASIEACARAPARAPAAGATAVPTMSGRTNFGTLFRVVCSRWVTSNPAARIESSVGRLHSHRVTNRLSPFIRSWSRARLPSSERTCSMNRSRPVGRSTRRNSRNARGWSLTPHNTRVETAASNVSSSNGGLRPGPVGATPLAPARQPGAGGASASPAPAPSTSTTRRSGRRNGDWRRYHRQSRAPCPRRWQVFSRSAPTIPPSQPSRPCGRTSKRRICSRD